MANNTQKYVYNQTIIKTLGCDESHKQIKIIQLKCVRQSGVEEPDIVYKDDDGILWTVSPKNKENIRGTVNSEKLACNVSRTKSKIFEYAFCNPWDWFFTGTLDRKKYDRTNLEKFHKTLTKWVYNYNRKYNLNIKFLFIPELHSDGKSWHIHGFLYGLPESHLVLFKIGDRMGKGLAEKVKNGDKVYNWLAYAKKFGFCDIERIHNPEAVSKYITKYITQDLAKSVTEINAHQYYHSRGLKTAEVIKKGTMSANIVPDFENEYCRILTCAYDEDLLNLLLSKIY